jgi:cellulose synthase (UDP-forming)
MHGSMLNGADAPIANFKLPDARKPDDAPRWAQTGQLISLGSFATGDELQADGSTPLSATFRLPPDMYYAERPNALLRLMYRYNSIPIGPISSMQVRVNNTFLAAVPLKPGQEASRTLQADVAVPVGTLRPFSNTMVFDFAFQNARHGDCEQITPAAMQGSILGDSFLDLRPYSHYAPLPNLETFADAGFPFTRLADLAETTVVLPAAPSAQEIEAFLTLMGHFSRQTGYPALRVTVADAAALKSSTPADFLIIGTGDDQPAFDKLSGQLPVTLHNGQIQVRDTQGFFAPVLHRAWWKLDAGEQATSGDITAGGTPDSLIEGLKSPFGPSGNRSIVAIHFKDEASFAPFFAAFFADQQSSQITGSVSVLRGAGFQSFRIGGDIYHVGLLPWWTQLQLWLMQYPYLVAIAVFLLAILLAVWMRQWLRAKARSRLRMVED